MDGAAGGQHLELNNKEIQVIRTESAAWENF